MAVRCFDNWRNRSIDVYMEELHVIHLVEDCLRLSTIYEANTRLTETVPAVFFVVVQMINKSFLISGDKRTVAKKTFEN